MDCSQYLHYFLVNHPGRGVPSNPKLWHSCRTTKGEMNTLDCCRLPIRTDAISTSTLTINYLPSLPRLKETVPLWRCADSFTLMEPSTTVDYWIPLKWTLRTIWRGTTPFSRITTRGEPRSKILWPKRLNSYRNLYKRNSSRIVFLHLNNCQKWSHLLWLFAQVGFLSWKTLLSRSKVPKRESLL